MMLMATDEEYENGKTDKWLAFCIQKVFDTFQFYISAANSHYLKRMYTLLVRKHLQNVVRFVSCFKNALILTNR